ncbi:uncharacterized protein LOC110348803 [Heterocephalus glaber]|uniref:Uncharacterized protein LOC110348803 n=1 Tax=Heterocephalus glaber TaxID=10181 RepID=A0AAX6SW08_HETGA|nr:uncharacterized protein LOC110348803 [Heterocephalus glaber]
MGEDWVGPCRQAHRAVPPACPGPAPAPLLPLDNSPGEIFSWIQLDGAAWRGGREAGLFCGECREGQLSEAGCGQGQRQAAPKRNSTCKGPEAAPVLGSFSDLPKTFVFVRTPGRESTLGDFYHSGLGSIDPYYWKDWQILAWSRRPCCSSCCSQPAGGITPKDAEQRGSSARKRKDEMYGVGLELARAAPPSSAPCDSPRAQSPPASVSHSPSSRVSGSGSCPP